MTDTLFINAEVVTLDPRRPAAQEVAVKNGVITAVGDDGELKDLKTRRTEVVDVNGQPLLPGFIDAHLHLRAMVENLITLNISPSAGIGSVSDIQSRISQHAQTLRPGEWIRGNGYNDIYLAEKRDPNRWELDAAMPHHPVKLTHRSGYAHVLNSQAMKCIGIDRETPDPDGGIIERDIETGEPTGQFYGLGDFLSARIPALDEGRLMEGVRKVNDQLISWGITSVQDASHRNDRSRWQFFEKLTNEGLLKSRVTMMLGENGFKEFQQDPFTSGISQRRLGTGGVKIILDETSGRLYPDPETLNKLVLTIHQSGKQVIIHAVEETAVEAACNAIEYAILQAPKVDHRHRIEHCSVCPPKLAKRIGELGIVVVTNPAFLYYSGDRYLETVPEEPQPYLYPISTLIHNKVITATGSDAPIAGFNPLIGIHSAVNRKSETDRVINDTERITVKEALLMATHRAAYSSFEEDTRGTIAPGKSADLVVLDANPLKVPQEEIKNISVEMTIVGGEVL